MAVSAGIVAVPAAATAQVVALPLRTAVEQMPVVPEVRTGWDRDLFPHWVDADRDGCNARQEVLIAEAFIAPQADTSCRLAGGQWYSYYDDARTGR